MTTMLKRTLVMHARDNDGLCGFCRRHHHLRITAGRCAPYARAAAFISRRRRERALRRLRVVYARPPSHY